MSDICQRILSQKKMQDTRRSIAFCYLCGGDLSPCNKSGVQQPTTGEHVIPRSLLGDVPKNQSETWAIKLDVHQKCEQFEKQQVDHWLKLLQEIHIQPIHKRTKPGHFHNMPIRPSQIIQSQMRNAVPVFTGCSELFQGVWQWIRGLHAALYLQFLPVNIWYCSFPPVPACSSQHDGPTFEETETLSYLVLSSISLAESLDKWDGITAWNGTVQYRCVCWQCTAATEKLTWICFWTLSFPRLTEWSRQVLPAGSERPWHGCYASISRPKDSAFLETDDFPKEA